MITYYVFVVCICECEQNFALISIWHISFCIVFFLLGILCYKKYKCLSFNLSLHLPPVPIMRMPSSLSTTTTTTSTSTSSRLPLACSPIHVGHRLLPPRAVPPDQNNQFFTSYLFAIAFLAFDPTLAPDLTRDRPATHRRAQNQNREGTSTKILVASTIQKFQRCAVVQEGPRGGNIHENKNLAKIEF